MKTEVTDVLHLKAICCLLLSVAAADKSLEEEELLTIRQSLQQYADQYGGVQDMEQVNDLMRTAHELNRDSEFLFKEFSRHFAKYPAIFCKERKYEILRHARRVANSFAQKNKAELIVLGRLELLFELPIFE